MYVSYKHQNHQKIIQDSDNLTIIHTIPRYFGCKTKEHCKITSNPPNRTIWFVDDPLWFADAAFCISKHPTSVKNHLQFRTFSAKSLHNPNKCLTFAAREPAKPLNDAQMCGSFFYMYLWQTRQYSIKLISHQKSQ